MSTSKFWNSQTVKMIGYSFCQIADLMEFLTKPVETPAR